MSGVQVCGRLGAHLYLSSSEQRLVQGHGRPHRLLVCELDIGKPGEPTTTNQDSDEGSNNNLIAIFSTNIAI